MEALWQIKNVRNNENLTKYKILATLFYNREYISRIDIALFTTNQVYCFQFILLIIF